MTTLPAIRGDTFTLTATVLRADGVTPFNFANCKIWFTIKYVGDTASTDTNAIAALSWQHSPPVSNGIVVADVTTGVAVITVPASSAALLQSTSRYVYDFAVIDASGVKTTLSLGDVLTTNNVTLRNTIP